MNPKKVYPKNKNKSGVTVPVIDGNIERAIKKLRRIVKDQNIMTSYYQHRYFVKPSVKKAKKQSLAKFRAKIWQRQQEEKLNQSY